MCPLLQTPHTWEAMLKYHCSHGTNFDTYWIHRLGLAAASVLGLFLQYTVWSPSTLVLCWLAHLSRCLLLSYLSHPEECQVSTGAVTTFQRRCCMEFNNSPLFPPYPRIKILLEGYLSTGSGFALPFSAEYYHTGKKGVLSRLAILSP